MVAGAAFSPRSGNRRTALSCSGRDACGSRERHHLVGRASSADVRLTHVYRADRDQVVVLAEVPRPSAGAPAPTVMANENIVLLAYDCWEAPPGDAAAADDSGSDDVAVVEFPSGTHVFGAPNDETLHGHPLYGRGLEFYAAHRVENSSWIAELRRVNSVHDMHRAEGYSALQHYIFTFHDSTFEIVSSGYSITTFDGEDGAFKAMRTRLDEIRS